MRTVDNWQKQKRIPYLKFSARCVRYHLPSVVAALRRFEIREVADASCGAAKRKASQSGERNGTQTSASTKRAVDNRHHDSVNNKSPCDVSVAVGVLPGWAQKTRATTEARSKEGRFYKPLPKEFRRGGFTYRQIAREGDTAIYEQRWTGCAEPSVCYEVIRIRRREGFQIDGRFVEPAELYPNSEAWGTDGFALTDRDAAFAKLREKITERITS